MTSNVPTLPLPADPVRRRLIAYFEGLIAEGEEGALAARGVESTATTAALVISATFRASEYLAFLKALQTSSTNIPDDPAGVPKSVALMLSEISELAAHHDQVAAEDERRGNHDSAQRRHDRADQLRGLLPGDAQ